MYMAGGGVQEQEVGEAALKAFLPPLVSREAFVQAFSDRDWLPGAPPTPQLCCCSVQVCVGSRACDRELEYMPPVRGACDGIV